MNLSHNVLTNPQMSEQDSDLVHIRRQIFSYYVY